MTVWFSVIIGFVVIAAVQGITQLHCYNAALCTHSGNERCAVGLDGSFKRFNDSCSIQKHNCKHRTEYVVTSMDKCDHLPKLQTKKVVLLQPWDLFTTTKRTKHTRTTITTAPPSTTTHENFNVYWCGVGYSCYVGSTGKHICGRERYYNQYKVFQDECTLAKYNCMEFTDYTKTNDTSEKCWKLIDKYNTPKTLRFLGNMDLTFNSEQETQIEAETEAKDTNDSKQKEANTETEPTVNSETEPKSEEESEEETDSKSNSNSGKESETMSQTGFQPPRTEKIRIQKKKKEIKIHTKFYGTSYSAEESGLPIRLKKPVKEPDIAMFEGECFN